MPYGRGVNSLKTQLGISQAKAEQIYDSFWEKYTKIKECWDELIEKESVQSPILGRTIRFSQVKDYTRFNWLVQGGCVDLLLITLNYILDSEMVELRGHFHDGLILACLCGEAHPGCQEADKLKLQLENLFPFTWPGTEEKVFKFGEVKWVNG